MAEKKLLYEGELKRVFTTDKEDQVLQEFKDDAVAPGGGKKSKVKNKGMMNNAISAALFEYLEGFNIPTYFVEKAGEREMLVRKLDPIPVEVVVRNVAAGPFCERYDLEEGKELKYPMVDYFLKDASLDDPLISESYAYALEYATPEEIRHVSRLAFKINAVLKDYFERRHICLVDFKLEFGRMQNQVYLAEEILPESASLWDIQNGMEKVNKERFRTDINRPEETYKELYNRILGG